MQIFQRRIAFEYRAFSDVIGLIFIHKRDDNLLKPDEYVKLKWPPAVCVEHQICLNP